MKAYNRSSCLLQFIAIAALVFVSLGVGAHAATSSDGALSGTAKPFVGPPPGVSATEPPKSVPRPPLVVPPPASHVTRNATPPAEVLAKAKRPQPKRPELPVKAGTIGLPRLSGQNKPGAPVALASSKFEADGLEIPAGASGLTKGQQARVTYLALSPGAEWSRPLRGSPHDVSFISLNLHASLASVIDAGGAWLSVLQSEKSDRAAIVVGERAASGEIAWRKLGYEVVPESFGGQTMAPLPIITIRRDPRSGTWDLYCSTRLIEQGLPLIPETKKDPSHKLTIRAGSAGAWLSAVTISDENPIYIDENANGIDDAFEVEKRGALLATTASPTELKALGAEWRKPKPGQPAPLVPAMRPPPDRVAAKSPVTSAASP